jgi:uncharacterized membrane protein YdcZ (DUF606 family)
MSSDGICTSTAGDRLATVLGRSDDSARSLNRVIARILIVSTLAFAGFLAGTITAAIVWILFFEEHPGDGSGNGRYGPLWGFVGGSVGAAIGCAAAILLLRRALPRTRR